VQKFEMRALQQLRRTSSKLYHEFLRTPNLSMGLYELPAGGDDPQRPHDEDEVYFIVSGQGMIQVNDEDQLVQAGSLIYVGAQVQHKFHSIREDLSILVFFAPAEGAQTEVQA
jgi:mannose-6-phosphate isomerase-like protein (cupin superfamily)